jgi:putative DNA primase/helicase
LTLIWNCLARAKLWTYPTGAYLVRALEQARFSLCLDELQYAEDKNLLRVINASQHRTMAYVPLLVPDHKGAYVPHEYFVWAPMALARLGEFSTAQQSRSIVIWMLPKLPGDKKEHLRRPAVPELADCRRQLIAWADSLTSWVDPELPASLNNRDVDNWIPLLFVAEQAGGQWPDLAVKAVEELMRRSAGQRSTCVCCAASGRSTSRTLTRSRRVSYPPPS